MNWDWDKLQEKRQRQSWGQGEKPPHNDERPTPDPPEPNKIFEKLKRGQGFSFPSGGSGGKWILLGLLVLWLLSGIYIVHPDEQGVVLRFGKYDRTVSDGPHYALPYPIEVVYRPKVTQVQRLEVGYRSKGGSTFQQGQNHAVPEESSTLTGDENIVNVQFSVQYQIKDPVEYLFNVTNQAAVVKNAAEAAMREVIGDSLIDSALTDGKLEIQNTATALLQSILDRYKVGVRVLAIQLQDVEPPKDVSDAFKDVASAREDKSRIINEAEAYRNEIIPKARGRAAEIENQALSYKETRIRNAEGEAQRFLTILTEYSEAKDVTQKRLYFEAMEEILAKPGVEKIIVPKDMNGILPLLNLAPREQATVPSTEKR